MQNFLYEQFKYKLKHLVRVLSVYWDRNYPIYVLLSCPLIYTFSWTTTPHISHPNNQHDSQHNATSQADGRRIELAAVQIAELL